MSSKPTKHYDAWRIRWSDEHGVRQSAAFPDKKQAALELQRRKLEVEERRRGLRAAEVAPRAFSAVADYWARNRAPLKRSEKDDLSILKQLRAAFADLPLTEPTAWLPAIDNYMAVRARLSKKTVANHLTLLGSILRVGEQVDHGAGAEGRHDLALAHRAIRLHYLLAPRCVGARSHLVRDPGEPVPRLHARLRSLRRRRVERPRGRRPGLRGRGGAAAPGGPGQGCGPGKTTGGVERRDGEGGPATPTSRPSRNPWSCWTGKR